MKEKMLWETLRRIAHCNGEGCHAEMPRCPDYWTCKSREQAILALIEQEQKPMRAMAGLLKDSAEHLRWAYRESPIPEDVQATLDEIDAVLGGK